MRRRKAEAHGWGHGWVGTRLGTEEIECHWVPLGTDDSEWTDGSESTTFASLWDRRWWGVGAR